MAVADQLVVPLAVSPEKAAEMVGIGRTGVYQEIKNGSIPAVKFGARTLIRIKDLEAWLERLGIAR